MDIKTEKISCLDVNIEARKMLICYEKGAKIVVLNPDGTLGHSAQLTSNPINLTT